MAAPAIIHELVERFERNRESYHSPQYNEMQLRREFLDPFFKALGWDIDNEQGHAEAYKDVIHEDAIKVGGATKAPDYCFRIGGRRIFFLEAKKPSVNVRDDISPAFQLRRYAWSAKLPLSVLSDFAELAVYDCRIKPDKSDRPSVGRILYLTCDQYVERWDELAGIFSREAVLKGSFDRFAESTKLKRGTAEVDAAFLAEIESWRDLLARNFALRNPNLSQRDLNFAVQRTVDRIIFLRMCEDRGIEPYGQLQALLNGEATYRRLCEFFNRADERYNSGLFHFNVEKGRAEQPDELTPSLNLDDKTLKQVVRSLYYPDSPYEFSVLPAEILGQVYEQFLGKVIKLTPSHRAIVEDKPEVKKAGGVYYTPTYIVDYIVKNTVGRLLEGRNPKQAAKLRVLDPACGSGSFLVGAYQFLLDWHRDWYVNDGTKKHAKQIYQGPGGQWHLTTSERKRILLDNIYGVDIDGQAVEVTKLSLLLKVLEQENRETLERQLRLLHERALPDLGNNIKCGNSLIGPDFYSSQQISLLDDEEQYRINAFDWNREFSEVFNAKAGGFDAVIGNPPYGAFLSEAERDYLGATYEFQTYQSDSYLLFLEQSLRRLLGDNGLYGMIIPNPWLTNLLQTGPRRFVTSTSRILEIVHFRFPVFKQATVDTEIVLLQKASLANWKVTVRVVSSLESFLGVEDVEPVKVIFHTQDQWQKLDGGVINIFLSDQDKELAAKCKAAGPTLGTLLKINVGIKPYQTGKGVPPQTPEIVASRPFDSDRQKTKQYRLYLRGSDIRRFAISPLESRYLKYGPWLAEPRPAANFDATRKIIMRQTGDGLVAALDDHQYLCLNNMHVLVPARNDIDLEFLLGIINSKLLNWYYRTLNPEVGEALAEVKKSHVSALPVLLPDSEDDQATSSSDRMKVLVRKMLALQESLTSSRTPDEKTRFQRQCDATDRQIDQLVYTLYRLTDEEIALVERAEG